MPETLKPSMEEQLALYRRRRKEEEERKARRNRLWNTIMSFMTFGMRKTDSTSSLSTASEVSEDKPGISSEENDTLSFKGNTSGVQKRRGGQKKESFSGMSTHYSDVEPPSSASSSFCSSYTTLDWVALGLKCLMWLIMFKVFIIIEFGAVYFICSAFIFIWYNMRSEPKKKGEISAYSVFNPDCKPIDGTFTAEQFERELLHKM